MKYSLLILFSLLFGNSCQQNRIYHQIADETMGTYYNITYSDHNNTSESKIKALVDSLLNDINLQVSTYIPESTISRFNTAAGVFIPKASDRHFLVNMEESLDYYEETDGYFDPSVMPLVNYWGFGYTPKRAVTQIDTVTIDSIMNFVGMDRFDYSYRNSVWEIASFDGQLDFSAIAKGYAVDQVGQLLKENGSKDFMIEIGGEVLVKGVNDRGIPWMIGINTPSTTADLHDIIEYLSLSDVGLASSGNYRIFHEHNGQKYGHTINPKTGYPEANELLAVTIIANSCMQADAYATACMVMGYEKAQKLINSKDDVNACFFVGTDDGVIKKMYSDGFIQYVAK